MRRPNSIRRTSSIDCTWPGLREGPLQLHGMVRDIYTGADGVAETLSFDQLFVDVSHSKRITAIRCTPELPQLNKLVGLHGFSELRHGLNAQLPQLQGVRAGLHQLLMDITGVLIVSDWAWASRKESLQPQHRRKRRELLSSMAGACSGFRPQSSALHTDGSYQASMAAFVSPLPNPADPVGWHEMAELKEVSLRRARRLDLWQDSVTNQIVIDSTFQDSASAEESNARLAVHEYSLQVHLDNRDLNIEHLQATPHILPFQECPGAIANIQRLRNLPVQALSTMVSKELRGVLGCTHLNDALRVLSDLEDQISQLKRLHK